MKYLIYILGLSCLLSAFTANEYEKQVEESKKRVSSYSYLEKQSDRQTSQFQKKGFENLYKNKQSLEDQLKLAEQSFQGDGFITKAEAKEVIKTLKEGLKYKNTPKQFLLYFFSESVPKAAVFNFIMDVDILIQNGFNIQTKQYMIGYPQEFQSYLMDWKAKIDNHTQKEKNIMSRLFELKLDPRFFKENNFKRVPVIALAVCANDIPEPESCKIKFVMHGDMPLTTFFDKIAEKDKSYIEYKQVLNANQIYKPKFEVKNEK